MVRASGWPRGAGRRVRGSDAVDPGLLQRPAAKVLQSDAADGGQWRTRGLAHHRPV